MGKFFFRLILTIQVFLYRLTGGKLAGSVQGFPVLLLTTTGRKTGKMRTTPLGYMQQDGSYVIVASYVAFSGAYPAWFHNLKSSPRARIQVKDRQIEVRSEVARQDQRGLLWARLIELAPFYANYAKRASREIPLVILHPVKA